MGYTKKRTRKYSRITGLGPGVAKYAVHNNTLQNSLRGLLERGWLVKDRLTHKLRPPPTPDTNAIRRIRKFTDQIVNRIGAVREYTEEQFIAQCAPDRRKIYEQAASDWKHRRTLTTRDCRLGMFIKAEKIKVNKIGKTDPAPRMIQPRKPIYNLRLGMRTRAVEEQIYSTMDELWSEKNRMHGLRTVMKGLTAKGIASEIKKAHDAMKAISFKGKVVAVSMDAVRWDQHVGVEALKEEHRVYNGIFNCDELAWLLRKQLVTEGRSVVHTVDDGMEHLIKYRRFGGRCSGDMNTGLGNTLLACGFMYTALEDYTCHLINNGDDCVVIFTWESYKRWKRREQEFYDKWTSYGFTMEMEGQPTQDLEGIQFCQMQPVCVDGTWTMIRGLDSIDKDTYIIGKDTRSVDMWMHNVGAGGRVWCAGVPVHQEFYRAFPSVDDAGNSANARTTHWSMKYYTSGMVAGSEEVTLETRISYWNAFGVCPIDQRLYEDHLRSLSRGPSKPYERDTPNTDHNESWSDAQWIHAWGPQD